MCRAVIASHLRKTHTVEERAVTTWTSENGFCRNWLKRQDVVTFLS